MLRFTILSVVLVFLSSFSAGAEDFSGSFQWPLKLEKQFSSGFGDTRPGRFHMGVDVRTGGQEGAQVFAPEDGYIYRIKTSYTGYGKGLYLMGNSGRMYVFGHLQRYNMTIGTYLQDKQIESKRYFQDLYLDKSELPVKKGEFIARTGQTGAGAPHLHFEIRNAAGHPINPLYFPVKFSDRTAPSFDAVWFNYIDESSLFPNGKRRAQLTPQRIGKTREFIIADTLVITGRIAMQAAISDYLARGSFTLGPSKVAVFIDGTLYHRVEYDRIPYDDNTYSQLDKDLHPEFSETYKRVYNLYRKPGNKFVGYDASAAGDGTFMPTANGFHTVLITASDAFGNESTLTFTFYGAVSADFLAPINKAIFSDSLIELPLNPEPNRPVFDTVVLSHPGTADMPIPVFPDIEIADDRIRLRGDFSQWTNFLLTFSADSVAYPPYYFSTSSTIPVGQVVVDSMSASIVSGGVLLSVKAVDPSINWLMGEVVTDAGRDDVFFTKASNNRFAAYYRPGSNSRNLQSVIVRGPVGYRPDTTILDIHVVRPGQAASISPAQDISLAFDAGDLFDTALLTVRDTVVPPPLSGAILLGPFVLGPEAYDFADWADFQSTIKQFEAPEKVGLYIYNEEKGWLWAGGAYDAASGVLHSDLGGTGVLAIISDTTAPRIVNLNIDERNSVKISRPNITFELDEELSGIENDLNFDVSIDGKWLSPEYDPERKSFVSKPYWRLVEGLHTLEIAVTDRCGNKISLTRKFRVHAKPGP
ncbi:MAG: M23 family metallopeptidase [Candidatus Zixiibacteriota bacterium]